MLLNSNSLVSMTEANQNFSKVARLVDEQGSVVILKNNVPRYVIIDFSHLENEQRDDDVPDDKVLELSSRLLKKNGEAYKVLASSRP